MRNRTEAIYARHGIMVYETNELYGEKGSFRVLQFADGAVQGAMDLKRPERIVLEYPRAIIHLMELNDPAFENVFMIGHGIGTIAGRYPDKHFTVAEVDEHVAEISTAYFGSRRDYVRIGDGRGLLEREASHVYDYIIVDAFTEKGTPYTLLSLQFFAMAAQKLTREGTIILNLMGRGENDGFIRAVFTTLGEVFDYTKAFSLSHGGTAETKNIIVAGSGRPIRYQAKQMAGFQEIEPGQCYIIKDDD
ncbi:spermidine synthase [Paenibacillus thermotolerans]|uniref:spermidine synthase n=1 Tax=Paenibacillus thermotolerans TaxID=3027807 RepID=UPI002367EC2F|nr:MULTISPECIES: fused MFS/spermidine synthase [unclassified Paenibacillus]